MFWQPTLNKHLQFNVVPAAYLILGDFVADKKRLLLQIIETECAIESLLFDLEDIWNSFNRLILSLGYKDDIFHLQICD